MTWLERRGSKRTIQGMARYGIPSAGAFGVPMGKLLELSKQLGKDHDLAAALWESGRYEARLLAGLIDDPGRVTRRQMNAWAADFDNWAVVDTVCFPLFSRTPFAWEKARQWSASPREFVKRAGFVLMACLVLRDRTAPSSKFLALLPLIERGARDNRNFVMKGVNWALRTIGKRDVALNAAAVKVATRLAQANDASPRWVGKNALRELSSPKVRSRLVARRKPASTR